MTREELNRMRLLAERCKGIVCSAGNFTGVLACGILELCDALDEKDRQIEELRRALEVAVKETP